MNVPHDGRLGVFAALGAATHLLPLPWVPDKLAERVRGALVHDIAARHGLSLTREARRVLSDPARGPEGKHGFWVRAARSTALAVVGKLGPVAAVPPLYGALGTYALGHLFDRYVARVRGDAAVRVDGQEARRIRDAIDAALLRAVLVPAPPAAAERDAPEEMRDGVTRVVDSALIAAAALPAWLLRRLDAAFDERISAASGERA